MTPEQIKHIADKHADRFRSEFVSLAGCIESAIAEALAAQPKEHDEEVGRWQQAIYELCSDVCEVDGKGTDSGDPLDFTLAEIGQAIAHLKDALAADKDDWRKVVESLDDAVRLLEVAQCPNCDGSGGKQISETEWDQCLWCHEKEIAIARRHCE